MAAGRVNAVVVGAGAGGGVVAKQLSEAGMTVILFERGGWPNFEEHDHDELISQRITVLGNAFGPDDERHRRRIQNRDGSWRIVRPSEPGYGNNAACVGSGTASYGAMAWRFMPQDFRMRSTYGAVEGSTLEDWPSSYDDLEPCYERAEWEIGVAGDDRQNPFAPPRRKPQPMPPFPYNQEGRILVNAGRRLGLHPIPNSDVAELGALRQSPVLHRLSLLRRVRLRSERQERYAQHGHTSCRRDRKLPAIYTFGRKSSGNQRSRPGDRCALTSMRKTASSFSPPTWSSSPRRRPRPPDCC